MTETIHIDEVNSLHIVAVQFTTEMDRRLFSVMLTTAYKVHLIGNKLLIWDELHVLACPSHLRSGKHLEPRLTFNLFRHRRINFQGFCIVLGCVGSITGKRKERISLLTMDNTILLRKIP